jgi:hypothetical protein
MHRSCPLMFALCLVARVASAQQPALPPADSAKVLEVRLSDGSTLAGRVVAANDTSLSLVTAIGLRIVVPRRMLAGWREVQGSTVDGFRRPDPNGSRLFFAPTARTLPVGEGYFGDYYLLFPTVALGVTERLTVSLGMSIIPGVSLGDQMYFVAPKLGIVQTPRFNFAAGLLYAGAGLASGGGSGGIGYGVGTFGGEDGAVTVGLGWPFIVGEGGSRNPWVMLGGERRVSDRTKLLAEVWKFPGANELPGVFGIRFIGERMAVDFGLMHVFGAEMGRWPFVPWVDFVIHW